MVIMPSSSPSSSSSESGFRIAVREKAYSGTKARVSDPATPKNDAASSKDLEELLQFRVVRGSEEELRRMIAVDGEVVQEELRVETRARERLRVSRHRVQPHVLGAHPETSHRVV